MAVSTTAAMTGAVSQDFEVSTWAGFSIEYGHRLEPGDLFEASNLLLSGKAGEQELIHRALSGTKGKHWAAAVALAYSGDARFVEPLLPLLDVEEMSGIGYALVTQHPKVAWPVLLRMANRGSVNAVEEISRYKSRRHDALDRLTRHPSYQIRIRALQLMGSVPHLERAIDDRSHLVVRAAVERLLRFSNYDKSKLYFHSRARIRAYAAELTDRWASVDYDLWARLAKDENAEVRYWAMTRLAKLTQRLGAHAEAIDAVRMGVLNGPPKVREVAVFTLRGWLFRWDDALENWPVREVEKVKKILQLKVTRDELLRQERDLTRHYVNTLYVDFPIDPGKALAMSGDKRAGELLFEMIRGDLRHSFNEHETHIEALALIEKQEARRILHDIIYAAMKRPPLPANSGNDYEASVLLQHSMKTLRDIGVTVDFDSFARIARDKTLDYRLRDAFVQALGYIEHPTTLRAVIETAEDQSEVDTVRFNAIFGLALNPSKDALAAILRLKEHSERNIAFLANSAEEQWRKSFGGSTTVSCKNPCPSTSVPFA